MTFVLLAVVVIAFVVSMAAFGVRARREVRAVRVAPLESGQARPAVLSAMERSER